MRMVPVNTLLVDGWMVLAFALLAWWLLYQCDQYATGTLLAFAPRWVLLVPIGILGFLAIIWRQRALPALLLASAIVAVPVMGLCVPWQAAIQCRADGPRIRLLTCNTQGSNGEAGLSELVTVVQPDIVVIQEWPSQRPLPLAIREGWQAHREGRLVIASRWPIVELDELRSATNQWLMMGLRCRLATSFGKVNVFALHLPTARSGLEAVLHQRLEGLNELAQDTRLRAIDAQEASAWIDSFSGPKLVAGDFNLPPESRIYRDNFSNWSNAFEIAGWGYGHTKYTRWHGLRIDHVLCQDSFCVADCEVGPDVGSDHRPVLATFVHLLSADN